MENWKDIKGYEGLYQVSDCGRVRSLCRSVARNTGQFIKLNGKLLSQSNCKGYLTVCLSKKGLVKRFRVNRLVACAFIPNSNNYSEVNHKDEIKINNHVNNLEWCTPKYNSNYGTKNKRQSGGNHWASKKVKCLNNNIVYETIKDASLLLGLPTTCVRRVVDGERIDYKGYMFVPLR